MLRIGQVEPTATSDGKYTDGNVAGGTPATRLRAPAFNAMQEELANIVESAQMTLDPDDMTQVLTALKKLLLSRSNPFGDIKSDGPAAIATALANLGLERFEQSDLESRVISPGWKSYLYINNEEWGVYSTTPPAGQIALPITSGGTGATTVAGAVKNLRLGAGAPAIGIPFFWPSAAMPNTVMDEWSDMVFLKWNGATFSATEYPKLALVIPTLKLQETRGEFIRVWDDGRGVDIGRTLLSAQQSSKLHEHVGQNGTTPSVGLLSVTNSDSKEWDTGWSVGSIPGFSSSSSGSDLQSFRPRNISFNFLVRAK